MSETSKYLYALDISMSNTGVAVFDCDTGVLILNTSISTKHIKKTETDKYDGLRLKHHADSINEIVQKYPPSICIVERGFSRFNTATQVLFKTHGLYQYIFSGIDYIFITPNAVKTTIYANSADKKDLQRAIKLNMDIEFKNEDESDAVAIGITYLMSKGIITKWNKPDELTTKDIQKMLKKKNELLPETIEKYQQILEQRKKTT